MMRAVMESAGLTFWPVFSLVLFCLFAAALAAWLYRRGSGDFYRGMAGLALEADAAGEADGNARGRRDDGKRG